MLRPLHALGLLLFAAAAHSAPVTYYYLGAPLTVTEYPPGGWTPDKYTQIYGTITLAAPLADTQANQTPEILSYTFNNDQSPILSDQVPVTGMLVVSTVKGVITAWDFELSWEGGNSAVTMSLKDSGDYLFSGTFRGACVVYPLQCGQWTATSTVPGIWLVPQNSYAVSQGALAWWTARAWQLSGQYDAAEIDVRNLSKGYMDANAIIARQNACIMILRHGGKC